MVKIISVMVEQNKDLLFFEKTINDFIKRTGAEIAGPVQVVIGKSPACPIYTATLNYEG